jgi:SAM-dependent methyltransferase
MAKAFPNSRFYGYDTHERSIETARQRADAAGVAGRVTFEVANASNVPNEQFDLICYFDCLHDMGDPVGAMKGAVHALAPGGSCMIVEPMAGNTVEENFNIIGRTFSGASTLCCTSNSLAQNGPALGAIATEEAIKNVATQGGFTEFRRATETPFNRIFEARVG